MIDLGHVTGPEVGVWPSRQRRLSKRWLAALVAIAVLLLVGAASSGRADPMPFVVSLASGPDASIIIDGEHAFVLDENDGMARIRAYGLPDGHLQWKTGIPGDTSTAAFFAAGSTIVVDPSGLDGGAHTMVGLDAATGRERWHRATIDTVRIGSGLLVWTPLPSGVVGGGSPLERVDPVTGRIEWTASVPDACEAQLDSGRDPVASGLVELCAGGRDLSVLDLTTGRIDSHRTLPGDPVTDGVFQWENLLPLDGIVYVVSGRDQAVMTIRALRAADLRQLWTSPQDSASVMQAQCAPKLCLETPHGFVSLDPQTGAMTPVADIDSAPPIRLDTQPNVLEWVVVPASRPVPAGLAPIDVTVVGATPPGEEVATGDFQPGHGTTTWITEQRSDGSYQPIGPLSGVGASCAFPSGYVLCATAPGRVSLWRLPPVS